MSNSFQIDIEARDKYSKQVADAQKSFEKMLGPIHKAHEKFDQFAKATSLEKGMERFDRLGTLVDKVTEKLGGIERPMAAFTGIASLSGMAALAASWGEMGEKVSITSKNLGMSGENLQYFLRSAEMAGVKSDQAAAGLQSLGDTLQDAAYGRNPAALNMMTKLGIHLNRTSSGAVDTADGMEQIAAVLQRMNGQPQIQRQIASTLGIADLIPLLRRGKEGLAALREEVAKTGVVMSDADSDKAESFTENVRAFANSLGGIKNKLGSDISFFSPYIKGASDAISKNRDLVASMSELWAALMFGSSALWAAPKVLAAAKLAAGPALGAIGGIPRALLSGGSFGAAGLAETMGMSALSTKLLGVAASAEAASAGLYTLGVGAAFILGKMGLYAYNHWDDLNKNSLGLPQNDPTRPVRNVLYNGGVALHDYLLGPGPDRLSRFIDNHTNGLPRPVRNHNPWDLRGWDRNGPHDSAGFDQFATDDDGITAASRQLLTDQREGINTISGIVSKASPASDGNFTNRMIAQISQESGFSPYQQLDLTDPGTQQKLLPAIFRQENAGASYDSQQILRDILNALNRMADNPPQTQVHVAPGGNAPRILTTSPGRTTLRIGLAGQDGN